jgi:outer membrane lipoprotein SlyB
MKRKKRIELAPGGQVTTYIGDSGADIRRRKRAHENTKVANTLTSATSMAQTGSAFGGGLGAGVGAIAGGPAGALVGSAIGTGVGAFGGLLAGVGMGISANKRAQNALDAAEKQRLAVNLNEGKRAFARMEDTENTVINAQRGTMTYNVRNGGEIPSMKLGHKYYEKRNMGGGVSDLSDALRLKQPRVASNATDVSGTVGGNDKTGKADSQKGKLPAGSFVFPVEYKQQALQFRKEFFPETLGKQAKLSARSGTDVAVSTEEEIFDPNQVSILEEAGYDLDNYTVQPKPGEDYNVLKCGGRVKLEAGGDVPGDILGEELESESGYTIEEIYQAISIAAEKEGLDPEILMTMAGIESNYDPNAVNKSGAKGLFQFMPKTAKEYGIEGKEFDLQANANAAAKLFKNNAIALKNYGVEPTPENLYLAHQQGAKGLADLYKAAETGAPLTERQKEAIRQNVPVDSNISSAQDFINHYKNVFATKSGSASLEEDSRIVNERGTQMEFEQNQKLPGKKKIDANALTGDLTVDPVNNTVASNDYSKLLKEPNKNYEGPKITEMFYLNGEMIPVKDVRVTSNISMSKSEVGKDYDTYYGDGTLDAIGRGILSVLPNDATQNLPNYVYIKNEDGTVRQLTDEEQDILKAQMPENLGQLEDTDEDGASYAKRSFNKKAVSSFERNKAAEIKFDNAAVGKLMIDISRSNKDLPVGTPELIANQNYAIDMYNKTGNEKWLQEANKSKDKLYGVVKESKKERQGIFDKSESIEQRKFLKEESKPAQQQEILSPEKPIEEIIAESYQGQDLADKINEKTAGDYVWDEGQGRLVSYEERVAAIENDPNYNVENNDETTTEVVEPLDASNPANVPVTDENASNFNGFSAASALLGGLQSATGLIGLFGQGERPDINPDPIIQGRYSDALYDERFGLSPQEKKLLSDSLATQRAGTLNNIKEFTNNPNMALAMVNQTNIETQRRELEMAAMNEDIKRTKRARTDTLAQMASQDKRYAEQNTLQQYDLARDSYVGALNAGVDTIMGSMRYKDYTSRLDDEDYTNPSNGIFGGIFKKKNKNGSV